MADDFSDSINTNGRLTVGGKTTGNFETKSDCDWFKITLEQGYTYYFTMTGAEKGGGTLSATANGGGALFFHDANGYMVQSLSRISPATGNLPAMPFTPTRSGDYYVSASAWMTGTYTLSATVGAKDDYGDYYRDSASLSLGGSKSGVIGTINDFDWYKSTLFSGKLYELRVSGAPDVTIDHQVYNQAGNAVSLHVTGQALTAAIEESGVYYAAVTSKTGTGNYTVKLTELADDFASNSTTTGRLSGGASTSGRIDAANDIDWFKLNWTTGTAYRFSADGGVSLVLKTINSQGNVSESGIDPERAYSASAGYDAYVAVSGANAGAYTVSLTAIPDDVGPGLVGSLGTQHAVNGRFDYLDDTDKYALAVREGHTYQLTLTVPRSSTGYAIPILELSGLNPPQEFGGIMRAISLTTDNATTISRSFKALDDGSIKAMVARHNETGLYTLTAIDLGSDDYGDSRNSAATATVGATASGRIDATFDTDHLKYSLEAGVSYVFTTGGELATKLLINGFSAPSYSSASGVSLYVTPLVSGDYHLAASSGTTGNYTIRAARAADDFAGNTSSSANVRVGGQADGVLESSVDSDWFRVDLEAGKTYDFKFVKGEADITIHDAQGNVLVSPPQSQNSTVVNQYTPAAGGSYFVDIRTKLTPGVIATSYNRAQPYTISVTEGKPDDVALPREVGLNVQVTGKTESLGDVDQFLLTLEKGHVYKLTLESEYFGKYRDFLGTLAIDRVDGNVVREKLGVTPADIGASYTFVAGESGNYRIALGTATTSAQGYRFKVEDTGQKDDYANSKPATPTIAPGSKLEGALDYKGDTDVFSIALQRDQTVNVALYGAASGLGTLDTSSGLKFDATYARSYSGDVRHLVVASPFGDATVPITISSSNQGSYVLEVVDVSGDRKPPKLVAGHVATFFSGGDITMAFDERLMAGSGRIGNFVILDNQGKQVSAIAYSDTGQVLLSDHAITLKLASPLPAGAGYTLYAPNGFASDWAGNDVNVLGGFTFNVVAAATSPGPGNDMYTGRNDGSRIDGGAGRDTASYGGSAAMHTIKAAGDGNFTVTRAGMTADTLAGIERLRFAADSDAIALDVAGTAGMAYRIYQAAFNRAPDKGGIGYWLSQMDQGMSLREVAKSFLASEEFQANYGAAPTDAQFVASLYQNVLHRAGESDGVKYWNDALREGADRAEVLAAFSESPENVAAIAGIIGNGFSYTPYG